MKNSNSFDQINIDLKKLQKVEYPKNKRKNFFLLLTQRYFYGLLIYLKLYDRLIDSGLIRGWFVEFRIFWLNHLNGRPLYFHDFNYLLGIYRSKFQEISIQDEGNDKKFLDAWQNNHSAYLLFGNVRKYSYRPLHSFFLEKYINDNSKILEYGAGIAPFSYSLINYSLKKNLEITIADIIQINFIYAMFRLSGLCKFKIIENKKHNLEKDYYDVVILQAVLEHVPDPIETIKSLHGALKKNGILIFDYILSAREGLDTHASAIYRKEVLNYIVSNFTIIKGEIDINKSMSTTIVKKK